MCTAFHYLHICYVITQSCFTPYKYHSWFRKSCIKPSPSEGWGSKLFIYQFCIMLWPMKYYNLLSTRPQIWGPDSARVLYIYSFLNWYNKNVVKSVAYSEVKETTWGSASLINSSIKERTHWRRQGFKMCIYTKFSSVYHLTYTVRSVPKYNRN